MGLCSHMLLQEQHEGYFSQGSTVGVPLVKDTASLAESGAT
eukprot:CAMPEP_0172926536 /NCGR_PEP_ID=MMETSP1075-20121228/215726_1 /TAXON_ID=2916 /ORGANISM="Ceratium fusus, Strain PA161109" /LENGTH=40 /DNA_ID= /DNA_START= /DNA_END= /DNA_ORIENTATION=